MSKGTQTKIINKIAIRTKFNPDGIEFAELAKNLKMQLNTVYDELIKLENKNIVILLPNMKVKLTTSYYTQNYYLSLRSINEK